MLLQKIAHCTKMYIRKRIVQCYLQKIAIWTKYYLQKIAHHNNKAIYKMLQIISIINQPMRAQTVILRGVTSSSDYIFCVAFGIETPRKITFCARVGFKWSDMVYTKRLLMVAKAMFTMFSTCLVQAYRTKRPSRILNLW